MTGEIKKFKKEIERLKKLAYTDELTGIYNRHGFQKETAKFINEVFFLKKYPKRRKSILIKNFSLIVFDIDNFKKLNDTYGHQAGDCVLKTVSRKILEKVRDIDVVARWGGEEIIIGLIGAKENDAFHVADDIRKKIEETKIKWQRKNIKFTISGGVADLAKAKNFEELFRLADQALYKAKKQGKNKIIKSVD